MGYHQINHFHLIMNEWMNEWEFEKVRNDDEQFWFEKKEGKSEKGCCQLPDAGCRSHNFR